MINKELDFKLLEFLFSYLISLSSLIENSSPFYWTIQNLTLSSDNLELDFKLLFIILIKVLNKNLEAV
jgi:hypothetical protein